MYETHDVRSSSVYRFSSVGGISLCLCTAGEDYFYAYFMYKTCKTRVGISCGFKFSAAGATMKVLGIRKRPKLLQRNSCAHYVHIHLQDGRCVQESGTGPAFSREALASTISNLCDVYVESRFASLLPRSPIYF